jgi:hypothetical protein
MNQEPVKSKAKEIATLASGCFWCTEAVYSIVKGMEKVESGYSGGSVPNPTYKQVSTARALNAPANGTVHVILTAHAMAKNDSASMWPTSNATGHSSVAIAGDVVNGALANEVNYWSLTTQGVYNVTEGNILFRCLCTEKEQSERWRVHCRSS